MKSAFYTKQQSQDTKNIKKYISISENLKLWNVCSRFVDDEFSSLSRPTIGVDFK